MDYSSIVEWYGPYSGRTLNTAFELTPGMNSPGATPREGVYALVGTGKNYYGAPKLWYVGKSDDIVRRLTVDGNNALKQKMNGVARVFVGKISSPDLFHQLNALAQFARGDDDPALRAIYQTLDVRRQQIEHVLIYLLQPPGNDACVDDGPHGPRVVINKFHSESVRRYLQPIMPVMLTWQSPLGDDHIVWDHGALLGKATMRSYSQSVRTLRRRFQQSLWKSVFGGRVSEDTCTTAHFSGP